MKSNYSSVLTAAFASIAFTFGAQASTEASPSVSQVCLSFDTNSAHCFIEQVEQGRSSLYTTERDYFDLALNEVLVQLNAEFDVISEDEYLAKLASHEAPSYLFSPQRIDIFDYASARACSNASGGWWHDWGRCVSGTVGEAGLAGLAAWGLGPVGIGAGVAFGAMTGAATFCSYHYYLHLNNLTFDISESQNWRGLKRCN